MTCEVGKHSVGSIGDQQTLGIFDKFSYVWHGEGIYSTVDGLDRFDLEY